MRANAGVLHGQELRVLREALRPGPLVSARSLLVALRSPLPASEADERALFASAEAHGLGGALYRARTAAGVATSAALARELELRSIAREADHDAHLAMLRRIDAALAEASIAAVALKGPLLAERLYPYPPGRSTSDIDLLVAGADLARATAVLETLGYQARTGADEDRFRREHHHIHLAHAHATQIELHFHGYSAFGAILPGEPLVAGRRPFAGFQAIGVLAPPDELAFLAIHAASHRFVRIAWLVDLVYLLEKLTDDDIAVAAARATGAGFGRTFALAGEVLLQVGALPAARRRLFGELAGVRGLSLRLIGEPSAPIQRSAGRFAYTLMLCDRPRGAFTYAWRAARDYSLRIARRDAAGH